MLITVAISLVVLMTATALTVDIGRLSSRRRDMQAVADAMSLDLARDLGGRTAATIVADPAWTQAIANSRSRNSFLPNATRTIAVSVGTYDPIADVFTASAPSQVPTAVKVVASDVINYGFVGGSGATNRTAIAAEQSGGGFALGSIGMSVNSSQSALLSAIIGQGLNIDAVASTGLAGDEVALPLLAEALGLSVGSPTQLLSTRLTMLQLISAEAEALRLGGDLARASLLNALALALPNPTAPITLGQLISIATGGQDAAADASIDALQLLTAMAMVANGSNFVNIPDLSLVAPGLAGSASLQVIEPPQFVFGPVGAHVSTAQVNLSTALTVGGTLATGVNVSGTAAVGLQVANGTGTIDTIACGPPKGLDIGVTTSLAKATINLLATVQALVPVANLNIGLSTTQAPSSGEVAFTFPPDAFGTAKPYNSGQGLNLAGATVTTNSSTLLGFSLLPLGTLVNSTLSLVLDPSLQLLDQWVTGPLSQVLGLTVANADVTPLAADCGGPALIQ